MMGCGMAALLLASFSAASPAASTLSLSVWNNTAMAGKSFRTSTLGSLSFSVPTAGLGPLSLEVTGTMTAQPNATYGFNCSFGGAHFGALYVDDHLVCQWGANVDSVFTPGQGSGAILLNLGLIFLAVLPIFCSRCSFLPEFIHVAHITRCVAHGCGGGGGHTPCAGIDNPLPTMSRTQLPVRLQLLYNPALLPPGTTPVSSLEVTVAQSTPATFVSALPPSEVQRRVCSQAICRFL